MSTAKVCGGFSHFAVGGNDRSPAFATDYGPSLRHPGYRDGTDHKVYPTRYCIIASFPREAGDVAYYTTDTQSESGAARDVWHGTLDDGINRGAPMQPPRDD